jgi:hypothetical protein
MDSFFRMSGLRYIGMGLLIFCLINRIYSQEVEHNYPVGPQKTNCDSLHMTELSPLEMISAIENSSFRFDQGFKVSRVTGIRAGHFYSCDGVSGYLILTIGKEKKIFPAIPKILWNEFITSSDLDGFYESKIKTEYKEIRE